MEAPIFVNARFVTQSLTGVQRYCHEITRALADAIPLSPGRPLPQYQDLGSRVVISGSSLGGHLWEQIALPLAVPKGQPLFSPAGCGPVIRSNHVITIHDIAPLENPEWYSRGFAVWYSTLVPALAKRVKTIITVSDFCKSRIMELLKVAESRIVVAGEAASECFQPRSASETARVLARYGISQPYFLIVGAVSGRKNLRRLFTAWKLARKDVEGYGLVVMGRERQDFAATPLLGELPPGARHVPTVSDTDLSALYSGARALLYPSVYEGFGLPILEAMACGCPVLTSACTAMPEVAGNAAVLVDPFSTESITEGIARLARGKEIQEHKDRGARRCRDFSWSRTAQVVADAIRA